MKIILVTIPPSVPPASALAVTLQYLSHDIDLTIP